MNSCFCWFWNYMHAFWLNRFCRNLDGWNSWARWFYHSCWSCYPKGFFWMSWISPLIRMLLLFFSVCWLSLLEIVWAYNFYSFRRNMRSIQIEWHRVDMVLIMLISVLQLAMRLLVHRHYMTTLVLMEVSCKSLFLLSLSSILYNPSKTFRNLNSFIVMKSNLLCIFSRRRYAWNSSWNG